MSLTNLNFENEIDVRARKALISDLWTRDSGGEFFKVTPGGGGTPVDLPAYLKTNSVEISGVANTKTVLDENSVDVNDLSAGTGTSLTPTSLTFGDSGGNIAFTKSSADAANKLATATTTAQTTFLGDGRSFLVWNGLGNNIIRTNNAKLTKTSNEYSTLEPTKLAVYNTTTGVNCAVNPSNVTITESGVPNILTKDSIIAANKLANINIVLAPSSAYQTVLYNSTTQALGYGTFTTPTTYQTTLIAETLPEITFGTSSIAFTPGGERAFKAYAMKDGDRLVLVVGGGVKYNQWYGLVLGSNTSQVIRGSVISDGTADSGATVEVAFYGGSAVPGTTYTIPQYSTFFRLKHSGTPPSTFAGRITLEKVSGNATILPSLSGTPV